MRNVLCLLLSIASAQPAMPQPVAQAVGPQLLTPNLETNIGRTLRYRPEGSDFVIDNGTEYFNRSLYGGNTAFRVDGGDRPEFVLYLPGRGGNLRLGLRSASGALWLKDARRITTRYRPGLLLYEIRDPLLGPEGVLLLNVVASHEAEALVLRAEATGLSGGFELFWAFGGVNGQRGVRDGDIGTERVPISEWFQLQPDFCQDNQILLEGDGFSLHAKPGTIRGLVPETARQLIRDAADWNNLPALLSGKTAGDGRRPVILGLAPLVSGSPLLLSLQYLSGSDNSADLTTYTEAGAADDAHSRHPQARPFTRAQLPTLLREAEQHFAGLRSRVSIDTPDPFLNAAVGALNVASDAVWDEASQDIMHGAIAWRTRLLGWRGPYALDALGWSERARRHFEYWEGRQNLSPVPRMTPQADAGSNLSRNEAGLHSNGDLSNSHYDMNLVFIDALFRHLRWTGDLAFARKAWPVIERHLAWERRLFRREFATAAGEKLPLYEAYAAIWASDDLQYSGGGTAHASAYNYWHNRQAAQLASLLGADPAPYQKEAELIARGMRLLLWQEGTGMFAENKDLLGLQLVHPDAALWSFYHVMDAELATPAEARCMANYVRTRLPHIPVRGPGLPEGLATLSTSDWMPYTWSLNNITLNENAHAALGLWQAGDREEAFRVLKGSLLASMFLGISPGNVGTMSGYDVYRRESQRDFADGCGTLSRALIEGLFGVRPDLLSGELRIAPGLPEAWRQASLHHPLLDLGYRQDTNDDQWEIRPHLARTVPLRLRVPARGRTAAVSVDGKVTSLGVADGASFLEIQAPAAASHLIRISWQGPAPAPALAGPPASDVPPPPPRQPITGARFESVDLSPQFNDQLTGIFRRGKYQSPRSPHVSLAQPTQGVGYWAGHVNAMAEIDDSGLHSVADQNGGRLVLPNGVVFAIPPRKDGKDILFTSQWDNYPRSATIPLSGRACGLHLLMAGSTNAMQSRIDNGEVIVSYTDGSSTRLALHNPETWWPIEQDYFIDDYQFHYSGALPTRVNLRTGEIRVLDSRLFKGRGRMIDGGAATVLQVTLDPEKELRSLTVRALANEVVIGLMAATLEHKAGN